MSIGVFTVKFGQSLDRSNDRKVKWRQKRIGRGELEQLLSAATSLSARAWCVSQAGFTPEALAFAAGKGILISDAEDLAALVKLAR